VSRLPDLAGGCSLQGVFLNGSLLVDVGLSSVCICAWLGLDLVADRALALTLSHVGQFRAKMGLDQR
jgi:hypothetical protein